MSSAHLTIARRAALGAGRILLKHFSKLQSLKIREKNPNDFVTEADLAAEKEILQQIQKSYPDHAIECEESGIIGDADSRFRWVIDPLDGTTNYIHGFPHFAVSIALNKDNKTIVGVIFDPVKNELYEAVRNEGATLNECRIRVSNRNTLAGALLGTGVPYHCRDDLNHYLSVLRKLIHGTAGIRRAGAASLDLAYVASGRLDGFWEFGLRPWDIAAGALLVREAGGRIGDMSGGDTYKETGHIVAAAPAVYDLMIKRTGETEGD